MMWYNYGKEVALRDVQPSEGSNLMELGHMNDSTPLRRCSKCGVEYPLTSEHFYKASCGTFRWSCKYCKRAYDVALRKTPEYKERRKVWDKKYTQSEKGRAFYLKRLKDPRFLEGIKRRSKLPKYKEYAVASARNRQSRKLEAGGKITRDDVQLQLKSQKGLCWWCGKPLPERGYEVDHLTPLARGGSNSPRNIVIAHRRCNRVKSYKMPWEFMGRLL